MKRHKPLGESKNQKRKYNHRLRRLTQIVFITRGAEVTTTSHKQTQILQTKIQLFFEIKLELFFESVVEGFFSS